MKPRQSFRRAVLWAIGLLVWAPGVSTAGMPDAVSYRGLLVLSDGRLAPDDRYELAFGIYDAPTAGNRLFEQTVTTTVQDGLYEIHLSSAPGQPLREALSGGDRYLDVALVSGGGLASQALAPRQRIASVPYALYAAEAESARSVDAPLPVGAVILWDQATGCDGASAACPCGFEVAGEFDGRSLRGPVAGAAPGGDAGTSGGAGADGDQLTVAELPAHDHVLDPSGDHRHKLASWSGNLGATTGGTSPQTGPVPGKSPDSGTWLANLHSDAAGGHTHTALASGGDGPHYHPLRSVLFCRKLAP